MSQEARVIPRKHIKVVLRDEEHKIFSLSIAELKKAIQVIQAMIGDLFMQASALSQADWGIKGVKPKRGKLPVQMGTPPRASLDLLKGFLENIINDPLSILEAASGLPHKYFDVNDHEHCLGIDEIVELAKIVAEVNNLGFLIEKVKEWWKETQRKNEERRQSAISAITSGYDRIAQALNTSNESSHTTSSPGFLRGLFARKKRRHMPPQS